MEVNKIIQLLLISMLRGGSCRSERRERPGMTDCENGVFIHLQHVLSNHLFFLVRDIMFEKV